ncbi:MAG: magnesium transporter [Candidatus Aenigmatarchaeota archaeon]
MPRKRWHPIVHHVRKKYRISRRTIFYMKEYGPKSHVSHVIIKESIRILILASIISSAGGIGLQAVQSMVVAIVPLLVMLPALNDMIGDFGTIVASRFAVMLYLGHVRKKGWWSSPHLHKLFHMVNAVALISATYLGTAATWIAVAHGFAIDVALFMRVLEIALFATIVLVGLVFFLSIIGGFYIFSKKEDPNNFLIPIATSVADLGSLAIFSLMVTLLF